MNQAVLVLLPWLLLVQSSTMRVLQLGVDEAVIGPASYARLLNHDPGEEFPEVFTLCYRSKTMVDRTRESCNAIELPSYHGGHHWVEFYVGYSATESYAHMDYNYFEFEYEDDAFDLRTKPPGRLRNWIHTCIGIDVGNQKIRYYEGGYLRSDKSKNGWDDFDEFFEDKPNNLTGMLLGAQSVKKDQWFTSYTSVNIFKRFLSDKEMQDITGCRLDLQGDYLAWDTSEWEMVGTNLRTTLLPFDEVCEPRSGISILFTQPMTFELADQTCKKFRGELWSPEKVESVQNFITEFSNDTRLKDGKCESKQVFWLGHRGSITIEGNYVYNWNTNKRLYPDGYADGLYPWATGYATKFNALTSTFYDDDEDAFVFMQLGKKPGKVFFTTDDKVSKCVPCFRKPYLPFIQIRGLCGSSKFAYSSEYGKGLLQLEQQTDGSLEFYGTHSSRIVFNEEANLWNWTLLDNPRIFATSNASYGTFLMGKHYWKFYGDHCFEDGEKHPVFFTACKEGSKNGDDSEYTCDDGLCVSMKKRCDGRFDCEDLSDEEGCEKANIKMQYSKLTIPYELDEDENIIQLKLNASIKIMEILKVEEIDSVIKFKFYLLLSWIDDDLSYRNLNVNPNLNRLGSEQNAKIWQPVLTFTNTEDSIETDVDTGNGHKPVVIVERRGKPVLKANMEELDNYFHFKGRENPLSMQREYAIDFLCDYELGWFPFDEQVCPIVIDLSGLEDNLIELIPGFVKYYGDVDLDEYYVKGMELKNYSRTIDNVEKFGVICQVTLGRKLISTIMKTYVPCTLLIIISYITSFLTRDLFETALAVNLTVMLVIGRNNIF